MNDLNLHNNLHVLLIEDDPVSNFIAFSKLKKFGIEDVKAVENGLEALNYLQSRCPDIIFLDINMPIMDGFEFLEHAKKNNICHQTSIAILTSSIRPCDKERATSFKGVVDFLEKPLDPTKIGQVLANLEKKNKLNLH